MGSGNTTHPCHRHATRDRQPTSSDVPSVKDPALLSCALTSVTAQGIEPSRVEVLPVGDGPPYGIRVTSAQRASATAHTSCTVTTLTRSAGTVLRAPYDASPVAKVMSCPKVSRQLVEDKGSEEVRGEERVRHVFPFAFARDRGMLDAARRRARGAFSALASRQVRSS